MSSSKTGIIRGISIALAIGLTAVVAGCGGGVSSTMTVRNATVSLPPDFSASGGIVTIRADVTASAGIKSVFATVTRPDGTSDSTPVTMTPQSGNTFSGAYPAPANTLVTGEALTYSVRVTVVDTNDRSEVSQPFTFEVPGVTHILAITDEEAVTPAGFSGFGGPVTIRANVTATQGVNSVYATVTRPDGSPDPTPVTMTLQSGNTYSGTYQAPVNTRTDGQAQTYSVVVTAIDNINESESTGPFTFDVPAPVLPPPPPGS